MCCVCLHDRLDCAQNRLNIIVQLEHGGSLVSQARPTLLRKWVWLARLGVVKLIYTSIESILSMWRSTQHILLNWQSWNKLPAISYTLWRSANSNGLIEKWCVPTICSIVMVNNLLQLVNSTPSGARYIASTSQPTTFLPTESSETSNQNIHSLVSAVIFVVKQAWP